MNYIIFDLEFNQGYNFEKEFTGLTVDELDVSQIPTEYINLQSYASKALNCQKWINTGLGNAANFLWISNESKFHDAFNEQFEKMFNREMSAEEKSIIKLAYIMGKTHQFQVKVSPVENK